MLLVARVESAGAHVHRAEARSVPSGNQPELRFTAYLVNI